LDLLNLNSSCKNGIKALRAAAFILSVACGGEGYAQTATAAVATNSIRLVELQGGVEILPAGTSVWVKAQANQELHPFDRIHTTENSRVALRWSDQSIVPFGASTELEILPPDAANAQAGLRLIRGILSFFHRDQPGRIRLITRGAVAGVEGTEFVMAVDAADRTTLSVGGWQSDFWQRAGHAAAHQRPAGRRRTRPRTRAHRRFHRQQSAAMVLLLSGGD
jgi:hypothetical protein